MDRMDEVIRRVREESPNPEHIATVIERVMQDLEREAEVHRNLRGEALSNAERRMEEAMLYGDDR
jgi:hypothetical protein